jgi:surface carbohydrate biosynthesis protein
MLNVLKYKYSFKVLKREQILFIDENFAKLESVYDSMFLDTKVIYIKELIKSFIKYPTISKSSIKRYYIEIILKTISPRIIIFNHVSYFNFKNYSNIKIIVYQHSYLYNFEIKNLKVIKCDYFLAINEQQKILLSKKVVGNIIAASSISSNCRVKTPANKLYDILLISEFRGDKTIYLDIQQKILNIVSEYAEYNNKTLGIAYNAIREEKKGKLDITAELEFYNNLDYDKNKFILSSYDKAAQSELIICISSNFGLELISHRYKVLFINAYLEIDRKYKLPHFQDDEGLFWTCSLNTNKICSMIDNILGMTKHEWESHLEKYNNDLLTGDRNNTVINEIINKCLTC